MTLGKTFVMRNVPWVFGGRNFVLDFFGRKRHQFSNTKGFQECLYFGTGI